jgi:hypothetical protein
MLAIHDLDPRVNAVYGNVIVFFDVAFDSIKRVGKLLTKTCVGAYRRARIELLGDKLRLELIDLSAIRRGFSVVDYYDSVVCAG